MQVDQVNPFLANANIRLSNQFNSSNLSVFQVTRINPVIRSPFGNEQSPDTLSAQALLDKQLSGALQNYAAAPTPSTGTTGTASPTPEQLAQQVLNNVNQRRSDNHDNHDNLDEINDDIARGFNQTIEALNQFGRLNQQALDDISKTYELIKNGLNRLSSPDQSAATDTKASTPATTDSAVQNDVLLQSLSQSSSFEIQRSFSTSLQIQTAEGDLVTIELNRNSGAQYNSRFQANASGASFSSSQSVFSDNSFQYTVNGDLNEEETDAIKNLLGDVSEIADKFFDGNLKNALSKTLELNSANEQISSYNVDLTYDEIISSQSQTEAVFTGTLTADAAVNLLADLTRNSPASRLFNQADKLASDLFGEKINSRFVDDPFIQKLPDDTKGLLQSSLDIEHGHDKDDD